MLIVFYRIIPDGKILWIASARLLIIPLVRAHTCAELLFFQRYLLPTFSVTHLRCAIWIHAVRYLHIQMMYFAAPWKSPVPEKISLLLANTHFISLRRALYLTAEFIHFLLVPLPHVLSLCENPRVSSLVPRWWDNTLVVLYLKFECRPCLTGHLRCINGFPNGDLHLDTVIYLFVKRDRVFLIRKSKLWF